MAKDKDSSPRSKVRIFYAEIDGNDDAVDALVQAFSRATQPQVRVVKVLSGPSLGGEQVVHESSSPMDDLAGEQLVDDEDLDTSELPPSRQRDGHQKSRKKPVYQFVSGLNFRPPGGKHLKDFYSAKAPPTSQEQITVLIYYLQKILECTGITSNHIYSAYKDVGVRTPTDIGKIVRNTSSRKGWIDSSDGANLRVTVSGENFVEHDLPKAQAK